jgi:hypothetical protein
MIKTITGDYIYVEYDDTKDTRTDLEMLKTAIEAESKIISCYMKYRGIVCFGAILGISVVVGACILGSKLKNKKDEED